MANSGKNILKIQVNGEDVRKAIKAAGYSICSIAREIGCDDKSIRTYIRKNEFPVLILDAIEKAVGDSVFFPGYKYTEAFNNEVTISKEKIELQDGDKVNHPNHYTFGSIEVIDYIRDKMTPDEFQGYCMGNILKYISRHKHKNGVEDLKKAQVYLGWLIESEEKKSVNECKPNFPEGTKVELVHYDPGTGTFTIGKDGAK